jgi:hypothetical protein
MLKTAVFLMFWRRKSQGFSEPLRGSNPSMKIKDGVAARD